MAGIETSKNTGIVLIDADNSGQINLNQIKDAVTEYGKKIIWRYGNKPKYIRNL